MDEYRLSMSERQLQEAIVELAVLHGWWVYHSHDSRRDQPGLPDLILINPPEVLFLEVKREKGRLRPEQKLVLDMLERCNQVDSYLVRPSDWPYIERRLNQRRIRANGGRGGRPDPRGER